MSRLSLMSCHVDACFPWLASCVSVSCVCDVRGGGVPPYGPAAAGNQAQASWEADKSSLESKRSV